MDMHTTRASSIAEAINDEWNEYIHMLSVFNL